MKINSPLIELDKFNHEFVPFQEISRLALEATEAHWMENQHRQQTFDVHYQTQSIVLLFCDCEQWPNIKVTKESGWHTFSPFAVPLMDEILKAHYPPGGRIIRAVLARLAPSKMIKPHVDLHMSFSLAHRIHVPITTNAKVRFNIGGHPFQLQRGTIYEVNNLLQHSVMNKGEQDRITFIFDYIPPENLLNINVDSQCQHL
jgi:hypothetical protein